MTAPRQKGPLHDCGCRRVSRPLLVTGHRGAMAVEPENTLRSFRRAEQDGADAIELDLHASADGILTVIHDATLDRTTDGSGRIGDHTHRDIAQLDAGRGEHVPTFAEVLEAVDLRIQVEIKDPRVVGPLVRHLRDQPSLRDRLVLSSFDRVALGELRQSLPDHELGLITRDGRADHVALAAKLGCRYWYPGKRFLYRESVAAATREALAVVTWLVDSAADVQWALGVGVAGISANDPGRVVGMLDR